MVHVFCEHLSPVDESACNPKPKSVRQTGRYPFTAEHNDLANDTRFDSPNGKDYWFEDNDGEGKKIQNPLWVQVEQTLWAIINGAYPPSDFAGRFDRIPGPDEPLPSIVKFQASATEQEIWRGALAVPDAPDHVVAWFRTIRNRGEYMTDQRADVFFDKDATLCRAASELRDISNEA